jgi:hypothetical protein
MVGELHTSGAKMRKPQDPRHHGLKEPKKLIQKTDRITLADLDEERTQKVPLLSVINAWAKLLRDHESQGHRIAEGPYFSSSAFYGSTLSLAYTYEWDNLNYTFEKAEYDLAVYTYEAELATFKAKEAEIKINPPNLERKIERAKQRLANLEATKAGEPIPYPEG